MKRLALTALLISLCVATAAAQDEEEAPVIYTMSEFCVGDVLTQRLYPQRALERDQTGAGLIDCTLSEDDRPLTCRIVGESTPGWGWGEAAIQTACRAPADYWRNATGPNATNYTDDDGIRHARRAVRFTTSE